MEPSFWEVKEFPGLAQVLRLPTVTIYKALLGDDSDPTSAQGQGSSQGVGNILISWTRTNKAS